MFFRIVKFVGVLVLSVLAFEHIFGMQISETIIDISRDVQQFEVKSSGQTGIIVFE